MEERVKNVMSLVFDINVSEINDDTSPDTVKNWDSLRHMQFIEALEDEFAIELDEEQIVEMMNYQLVLYTLKSFDAIGK